MMERVTIKGDRPFGTGDPAPVSQIRRRKVPSLRQFKNRPKRQHEMD
jgi:hypothetical protein